MRDLGSIGEEFTGGATMSRTSATILGVLTFCPLMSVAASVIGLCLSQAARPSGGISWMNAVFLFDMPLVTILCVFALLVIYLGCVYNTVLLTPRDKACWVFLLICASIFAKLNIRESRRGDGGNPRCGGFGVRRRIRVAAAPHGPVTGHPACFQAPARVGVRHEKPPPARVNRRWRSASLGFTAAG